MRTVLLLPVVAVVVACASDSTYGRGTYVRPPSTTTRPPAGTGAPEVGQPGARRVPVPRSDGKELPASERHEMWATGKRGEVAVSPGRTSRPVTRTPDGIPEAAWRACWQAVQGCMNEFAFLSVLSDDDYECLRWQSLQACGGFGNSRTEHGHPMAVGLVEKYGRGWNTAKFYKYTEEQSRRVCLDSSRSREFHAAYTRLYGECSPRWVKAFTP